MRRRVQVEKETRDIEEVRVVDDPDEVNQLLVSGWVLLSSGARHIDSAGFNAKVYFIVGRR